MRRRSEKETRHWTRSAWGRVFRTREQDAGGGQGLRAGNPQAVASTGAAPTTQQESLAQKVCTVPLGLRQTKESTFNSVAKPQAWKKEIAF